MLSSQAALQRLRDGNRRFASGVASNADLSSPERRAQIAADQTPFAIILGCSDSRVPAELVFDQGLGDLFVIRVAGNIVAPSQIGSVEFAAEWYGTRLVVVLGHSRCGAVLAAIAELTGHATHDSRNLRSIVDRIRPAILPLVETDLRRDPVALTHHAVRANIRAATDHLRHGSHILEDLIRQNRLLIVSAEYCLDTGLVDFFDIPNPD